VRFYVLVQLGGERDEVTDPTAEWAETRSEVEFGTLTITERVDELAPDRRKIIFDPIPRVDGIDPVGDPLTGVRSEIYLLSGRRPRDTAAKWYPFTGRGWQGYSEEPGPSDSQGQPAP
jgi:catalase